MRDYVIRREMHAPLLCEAWRDEENETQKLTLYSILSLGYGAHLR